MEISQQFIFEIILIQLPKYQSYQHYLRHLILDNDSTRVYGTKFTAASCKHIYRIIQILLKRYSSLPRDPFRDYLGAYLGEKLSLLQSREKFLVSHINWWKHIVRQCVAKDFAIGIWITASCYN